MVATTQTGTDLFDTDGKVIDALLILYGYQEADERRGGFTAYQNGRGFDMIDAGVMSDIAQYYIKKGYLSPRQIAFVKGRLGKYRKQLAGVTLKDMPNKYQEKPQEVIKVNRNVSKQGTILYISFTYDPRLVDEIKKLPDRTYITEEKRWRAKCSYEAGKRLMELGFEFDAEALRWWQSMSVSATVTDLRLDMIKRKLFPFQEQGVHFIDSKGGRALIGDEMGLGKTCQAISWVAARRAIPALVVCPASLKLNWAREVQMWTNLKVHVISGATAAALPKADVYIINYDILRKWRPILQGLGIATLICDESHYLKNRIAQRTLEIAGGEISKTEVDPVTLKKKKVTTKFVGLCETVPHVICLSGTPILNRPVEMFTSLRMIRPDLFPSFWRYAERYCDAQNNGFGWDFNGATNVEELHKILTETIMLRRLKKDVLTDLPPKIRTVVPIGISNRKEYNKAKDNLTEWIRKNYGRAAADAATRAEALVRIERLKQLTFKGKLEQSMDWIRDYLEQNNKLVVFTTHQEVLDQLVEIFTKEGYHPVAIDGRTPTDHTRQDIVDQFQNDPKVRIFVGNIKAAGVGLTLTEAAATCFLELDWTPGLHDQAEDRVHRIGQTADSVFAYYLLAENTIEEEIAELIDNKRRVLDAVLDGKKTEDDAILAALLNKMLEAA